MRQTPAPGVLIDDAIKARVSVLKASFVVLPYFWGIFKFVAITVDNLLAEATIFSIVVVSRLGLERQKQQTQKNNEHFHVIESRGVS